MRKPYHPARAGMVLILVLVVIALLSLAGYTFSELMLTERRAADAQGRRIQTRALADSGIAMILNHLAKEPEIQIEDGGHYDNPGLFRGMLVVDSPSPEDRGRFTVLAPAFDAGYHTGVRFGLEDESTRVNLNTLELAEKFAPGAARNVLMQLPGMTEDVADAILDWIDVDEEPREYGAESDEYSGLTPPYGAKNGPLDSIEELLLVRGVDPRLLYGLDEDRNGVIDDRERALEAELGVDNSDGSMDFGWSAYLTLISSEGNLTAEGVAKIDLNQDDMATLHQELTDAFSEEWANFIVAYRQFGPSNTRSQGQQSGSEQQQQRQAQSSTPPPDLSKPGQHKLKSILDLIDARVEIDTGRGGNSGSGGSESGSSRDSNSGRGGSDSRSGRGSSGGNSSGGRGSGGSGRDGGNSGRGGDSAGGSRGGSSGGPGGGGGGGGSGGSGETEKILVQSPFVSVGALMDAYMPLLMETVTVNPSQTIPGRININQAPAVVLLGIPGMTPEIAERILSAREPEITDDNATRKYETWLLSEELVTLDEMKALMPFVTGGGSVYRATVIGFFDSRGPISRIEAVIDNTGPTPKLAAWKEYSHLGGAYSRFALGGESVE